MRIVDTPENPRDLNAPWELVVSNTRELAALITVIERKGILTQRELLQEIKRLRLGQARGM